MPGLFQTECVAACVDYFPQEHRDGDGVDVVFDQEQTYTPDQGVEICMRRGREIKVRFVHTCLPRGACGHAAGKKVLVCSLASSGGRGYDTSSAASLHQRDIERILACAATSGLPAMYQVPEKVRAGGLMASGASVPALFRRAATSVDQILKGAKPADLPVEQPMKFALILNLKTAQALGITLPPTLLLLADEVIR